MNDAIVLRKLSAYSCMTIQNINSKSIIKVEHCLFDSAIPTGRRLLTAILATTVQTTAAMLRERGVLTLHLKALGATRGRHMCNLQGLGGTQRA